MTGLEASELKVLSILSPNTPRSFKEIRKALGTERFTLSLGGGQSLEKFISQLYYYHSIDEVPSEDHKGTMNYILTDKGLKELLALKNKRDNELKRYVIQESGSGLFVIEKRLEKFFPNFVYQLTALLAEATFYENLEEVDVATKRFEASGFIEMFHVPLPLTYISISPAQTIKEN